MEEILAKPENLRTVKEWKEYFRTNENKLTWNNVNQGRGWHYKAITQVGDTLFYDFSGCIE